MITAPVLDTHAWIWWVSNDKRLGKSFVNALDNLPADQRPWLCDISLWETATLFERGRISFNVDFEEWMEAAAHPRTVRIAPISAAIAVEVASLPKWFHRDPADRLIVATCRALKLPLLSKDKLIAQARLVEKWKPGSAKLAT
jgi:PIN domain nuclease of toxin-antitoxin system